MKHYMKNNLIWMFALVLSIGTMSFKLAEKQALQTYWFEVNPSTGAISSSPHNPGPECDANPDRDYFCSVAFDSPTPPATNINQTSAAGGSILVEGVLYKDELN